MLFFGKDISNIRLNTLLDLSPYLQASSTHLRMLERSKLGWSKFLVKRLAVA